MWELDQKETQTPGTDAFELQSWRFLRVPWTVMRSNWSILKKISHEYSLKGLILKLKLQYFGYMMLELTHWKRPWCWERLMTGGEGEGRGWDGWMASPTQWTWVWASSRRWWRTGEPDMNSRWGLKQLDMTEWLKSIEGMMCYVHNIMIIWLLYISHIDKYAISVSGIIICR